MAFHQTHLCRCSVGDGPPWPGYMASSRPRLLIPPHCTCPPHCPQLSSFGGDSYLTIRFQLNVPPLTDFLASVTSKSCWPPPRVAPLITYDLSLVSEWSSMVGDGDPPHPIPSSISTTVVPGIQWMLAQHLLNKHISAKICLSKSGPYLSTL